MPVFYFSYFLFELKKSPEIKHLTIIIIKTIIMRSLK